MPECLGLFGLAAIFAGGMNIKATFRGISIRTFAYMGARTFQFSNTPLGTIRGRERGASRGLCEKLLDDAGQLLYCDPEFDRHLPFLYHKPKNTRILH